MRAALFAVFLLAGCGGPTVIKDRVEHVSVPVIQKCASEKPTKIVPLNEQVADADWAALSLKQKSERAAAQGLRRIGYTDALEAATSAC
ncbi:hypothetical protein KNJ79_05485 [Sphingopyxis indica]|uniref:hypothetical protein n=1 Tax=Sphingopyxis indica TaxID=436663 RepID=UPI002938D9B9|nr:hypothetical protein [Sphingopyxis indica]WOF44386.1 hypothetical protein KNJ79_05485 [Sphingopyxis indica]